MTGRWRNLNSREILDQIGSDDLTNFVVQYAKKHPDFMYKLIARFAPQVSIIDESEKYEFLFYKSLHHYLPGRQNPTKVRIQNIRSVYDTLSDHAKDFISLEQYVEAFEIIRFGIIYTKLLVKRVTETIHASSAHDSYLEFHKLLGQLINRSLPPPLIDRIREYCIEESLVYDYISPDRDFNLYNIALRLLYDHSLSMDYINRITAKLVDANFVLSDQSHVKKCLVEAALKWEEYDLLMEWNATRMIHQDEWESLLRQSLRFSDKKEIIKLAKMLAPKLSNLFRQRILIFLLESFPDLGDDDLQIITDDLLKLSGNIGLVYNLSMNPLYSKGQRQQILNRIELAVGEWGDPTQKIEWLIIQGRYDQAIHQMLNLEHVEDLIIQLEQLPYEFQKKATKVLLTKVDSSLESAFGPLGAKKVQEAVNLLRRLELYRIADDLVSHIRDNFPRRKSLTGIR